MVVHNDENLPFSRFPNVASRERHYDYHATGLCCERAFVLRKVEEKDPAFYTCLIKFRCLPLNEAPQMFFPLG